MSEELEAKPNLNENGNADEDDSLDSFFKKKDKKGKKKKGKKSEAGSLCFYNINMVLIL